MKKILNNIIVFCLVLIMCTGCGAADKGTEADLSDKVASADEMASPTDVIDGDMTPVYADELHDGVYSIDVKSSSSMFNVVSCELTVDNGMMTAVMTMSATGYLYVYMGTGEEAVLADEADYIPFDESAEGVHTYTVPVEALDKSISCAAYSKSREKWYDRQLVFCADNLPDEAFVNSRYETVDSLSLEDGIYTIEVTIDGGSGKAYVESPATLVVTNKIATATIIWSSNNYDYMLVDDEKYFPVSNDEASVFEIPVMGFDYNMPVKADTTAMSTPYEIEYTLYFDSSTILKSE